MDTTDNNSNLHPPILEDAASKSKLCIKIKIPTSTSEEENGSRGGGGSFSHNFQLQPGQLGYRVCEFCGKEFTSGKAWGGHKRHHLKMMKDTSKRIQEISNNNIKIKKYNSAAGGSGGGGGSDGSNGGSKIVRRRGCNIIKAGDVIMGSDGKPTCCLCGKVFGSLNSLFGHMKFHPERDWKGTQPPPNSNSPTEGLPFACSRFGLNQNQNQSLNQIYSGSDDTKNMDLFSSLSSGWSKRDKRGRVCLSDLIPQAAHSLLTLSREMAMDNETSGSAAAAEEIQAHETEEEEKAMGSCFQCDICEKTFPTGQALGGHKRCHWKAPAKAPPALLSNEIVSAASNTASSEEAIQAGHGMLGIDLNKPYVMQEDDEESFNDED